jgi:DNA end-binding protein Ku
MARKIWKGAISFGLVHIPVGVVSATSSGGVDFDWLDERSMDPVGYKRINKVSGKEVTKEHIVKGVKYEKGRYVVLSEDEIKAAHPKSTQTIDIFGFVDSVEIPLPHIDTPYYLSPDKRGEKVYALLRETLSKMNKVALARVVLHTRQHLAALMPMDAALVLVLLRWPEEVRGLDEIDFNEAVTHADLSKKELDMARRLVEDMSTTWQPEEYQDTFTDKIMQLVEKKARDGKIEDVERTTDDEPRRSADVVDLTELLKRSLGGALRSKSDVGNKSESKSKTESKTRTPKKSATGASPKTSATKKSGSAATVRKKSTRTTKRAAK